MSRVDFESRLIEFGSSTYPSLRDAQRHVLNAYGESHLDTPDLAIQLSTGLGKTLIALLIADYALDQGKSVAYLTGSKALTAQVKDQADLFGLAAHQFWGRHYPGDEVLDYHDAQALGIMNYWV
jgi:superfamily II DNA or RNA helicase